MKKQKCFVNREMLLSYIMACGSQCHQRQYRRQGTKLDRYWGITKHRKERYLRGRMLLVTLQHDLLLFYWPFQGGTSFVDLLYLALVCGVFCEFVTFPLVSWVRCGTWLYRFLIFAPLLTFNLHIGQRRTDRHACLGIF